MSEAKKPERPLFLDMDFGEALARYAQKKPEELEPPPGKVRKAPRPERKPKPGKPTD